MKILLVSPLFYPRINGPIIYIDNLAQEFKKLGHKITIFTSGKSSKDEKFKGMQVIRFKKAKKSKDLKKYYEEFRKNSDKEIKKLDNFDMIISKSHIFLNSLKKRFRNNKIIYIIPSLMAISSMFQNQKQIKKMKEEIKSSIKGIKLVLLSKISRKILEEKIGRKKDIKIIPLGIDIRKFNPHKKKEDLILFVGRLSKEKNMGALINTFSKTKKGKLLLVGDGEERNKLENLIKKLKIQNKVIFTGKQKNPEKYFSKSKIFVLSSIYESFGFVLLEAMASGLPCIAFKPDGKKIITASDEIIKNGKTGFLVKDEKEMTEKIDLLLSDDKLREKMGKLARKEAEKYSWEKTAKEILKFTEN